MKNFSVIAAVIAAVIASGCVAIPKDRGMEETRALLTTRSAHAADSAWRSSSECGDQPGPLTADNAVAIALHCSPRMRLLYADLALSQAEVYAATRLANPELDFVRLSTGSPANIVNTTFGITQRFVELLFLPSRQRLGAAQLAASRQKVAESVLQLERDVRSEFVRHTSAIAIAELQARNAMAARLSADTATEFHAAGNISELQLSRERAAAVEAQIEADRAKSSARHERGKLMTLLGVLDRSVETPLAASGELPLPPVLRNRPDMLRAAADQHRLDLQAAKAQVIASASRQSLQNGSRWFGDLSVGYERERETGEPTREGPRAAIAIPLFNSGKDKVLRATAEHEAALANLSDLQIALHNDAAGVLYAAATAHSITVAMRSELLPLRERITALSQREFNYMFIGAFELLAIKREELRAYRQYLEAVRDEWLAYIDVLRVAGGTIPAELVEAS